MFSGQEDEDPDFVPQEGAEDVSSEEEEEEGEEEALVEGGERSIDGQERARPSADYSAHVYKVLQTLHPNHGISRTAMAMVNSYVNDTLDRIAAEAGRLASSNKKTTVITEHEIQAAVQLLLEGKLAKNAMWEGKRAVSKYRSDPDATPAALPKMPASAFTFFPGRHLQAKHGSFH